MSPVIGAAFKPAWWCPGPHVQTLWPYLLRPSPRPIYRRERIDLDDGDFLDLDWHETTSGGPLVWILHGLEGDSQSHYVRGLVTTLARHGMRSVVMHHRGCSGEPNRLARGYHAGESADLDRISGLLHERADGASLFAVGYSLGGNMLLKWLGESEDDARITAAVAACVPLELADCAQRMNRGLSRLYQRHLVRRMRRSLRRKFAGRPFLLDMDQLDGLRTFRAFDDAVTAPLHGFRDADQYYALSSSRQYLGAIRRPVLIIQALDDPFMTPAAIPAPVELSASVQLELCSHGGHCGFVAGRWPWAADYWLERRIGAFLTAFGESR